MPVKTRRTKRRIDPAAEMQAWWMMFECGRDYFRDLAEFGYDNDSDAGAAAREAWERLGRLFLRQWEPAHARAVPWALQAFGEPTCR